MSTALTLLKNNGRKRREKHSVYDPKLKIEAIRYDFPEVSAEKRKAVTDQILHKRKVGDLAIYISVIILFLLFPVVLLILGWI